MLMRRLLLLMLFRSHQEVEVEDVFEPVSPGEGVVGGEILSISGNAYAVAFGGTFTLSDKKIVINGFPITLYENNGIYSIATVNVNSRGGMDDRETFFVDGTLLKSVRVGNDRYFPIAEDSNASVVVNTTFEWYGMHLAMNNEKHLIFQSVDPGSFDEETRFALGGMPLTVGRVGNNWYLLVYRVN